MARREPTHEEMVQEIERFQGPPSRPKVHLGDEQLDLWDSLAQRADLYPDGPERDEAIFAMRRFKEKVEEIVGAEESFQDSPINKRTQLTDPRGRAVLREEDSRGNIRDTVVMDKEQRKEAENTIQAILDERNAAAWDRERATKLRSLAYAASESGASSAFDHLMKEAADFEAAAKQKLDQLRETVPENMWTEYNLGQPPPPLREGVAEALELLHEGKVEAVFDMVASLDPAARYQFMEKVPPEEEKYIDAMLKGADAAYQAAQGGA